MQGSWCSARAPSIPAPFPASQMNINYLFRSSHLCDIKTKTATRKANIFSAKDTPSSQSGFSERLLTITSRQVDKKLSLQQNHMHNPEASVTWSPRKLRAGVASPSPHHSLPFGNSFSFALPWAKAESWQPHNHSQGTWDADPTLNRVVPHTGGIATPQPSGC